MSNDEIRMSKTQTTPMVFRHLASSFIRHSGFVILVSCTALQAQQTPQGLDSLTDDKLMNELAVRRLPTLLDRAFEVNKVPQSEQESRRAILSLQTLSDPTRKLSQK